MMKLSGRAIILILIILLIGATAAAAAAGWIDLKKMTAMLPKADNKKISQLEGENKELKKTAGRTGSNIKKGKGAAPKA